MGWLHPAVVFVLLRMLPFRVAAVLEDMVEFQTAWLGATLALTVLIYWTSRTHMVEADV